MRDSSSILCLILCLAGCAGQADPAQRLAEAFLARESIGVVRPDMTLDAAYALQNAYVEHLSATLGGGGGRVQGGPDEPGDAGTVRRGASAVRRVAGGDAAPLRQRRPGRLRGAPALRRRPHRAGRQRRHQPGRDRRRTPGRAGCGGAFPRTARPHVYAGGRAGRPGDRVDQCRGAAGHRGRAGSAPRQRRLCVARRYPR